MDRAPPIGIVGTGLIGRAWTIAFARAGHPVSLFDPQPGGAESALAFIDSVLDDLAAHEQLGGNKPTEVRKRIRVAPSLKDALDGAVHVQESAPEELPLKQALFAELDRLAPPSTVLASSSSALVPSSFTAELAGRGRCLVAHPINPPYLIPAVELVPAPWTDPAVVEHTADLMRGIGQVPVTMQREIDGFIVNRLQGALLEEAFRLVDEGYALPEDVDIAVRDGLALRWSCIGPFETIDLNAPGGVVDYVRRYESIYANIHPTTWHRATWSGPVLATVERERRKKLPADGIADRQRWRDRRLMALLRFKRRARDELGD